jgi:hypothetical protein
MEDVGIVIDAEDKFFDILQQLDMYRSGVVLGLFICKGLADILNYDFKLESIMEVFSLLRFH